MKTQFIQFTAKGRKFTVSKNHIVLVREESDMTAILVDYQDKTGAPLRYVIEESYEAFTRRLIHE